MRLIALSLVLALAVPLAACTPATQPTQVSLEVSDVAFNPAQASFIKKSGVAVIEGEAFLRENSGGLKHASGEVVRLIPQSDYARSRFAKLYGGEKYVSARDIPKVPADPSYVDYTRTTKVDERGHFTFDHVPPGRYFVSTQVLWKNDKSFFTEGGAIYDSVTISAKDTEDSPVKVIVSGK